MRKSTAKIRLGDVIAIPLPDGKYAFGRLFRNTSLSIYEHVGETSTDLPQAEHTQFTVAVENTVLTGGQWPVVDHRPFRSEEDAWPPPSHIFDRVSGKYFLYNQGVIRASSKEECEGLEPAAEWEEAQIVERIMNGC